MIKLGLDIGIASIGWAMVDLNEKDSGRNKILGIGSRILPMDKGKTDEFSFAVAKSKKRTTDRGARRRNWRYKMRRELLLEVLQENDMKPDKELFNLHREDLFHLRSRAANEKVELKELGRVLFWINQKRGFKSNRKDKSEETNKSDWLNALKVNVEKLKGRTIGEYFYEELKDFNEKGEGLLFQKTNVRFPRQSYLDEFEKIWSIQAKFHKQLSESLRGRIRDEVIFFQRNLKSQKHLVGGCTFEKRVYIKDGKRIEKAIKVCPISAPLFQEFKIWQSINSIEIKNLRNRKEVVVIDEKMRSSLFKLLSEKEKISHDQIIKACNLNLDDYRCNYRQLSGNVTKHTIVKALRKAGITKPQSYTSFSNEASEEDEKQYPLFWIWHMLYSISDPEHLIKSIIKKFGWSHEVAAVVVKEVALKDGFGSLSSKAIRKILPYLVVGDKYSVACEKVGYRHSDFETKEERIERKLKDIKSLKHIKRGNLRSPAVEKIVNHLINLVKDIYSEFGVPDEISVEMARALKQSGKGREQDDKNNRARQKKNAEIRERLKEHFKGRRISGRDVQKYKLWEEFDKRSPYNPTKVIGLSELFSPSYEIEHIIPKARFFDDSLANKIISHVNDNRDKGAETGFDFMRTKRPELVGAYEALIQEKYRSRGITKSKFDRLYWKKEDIPDDFLNRDLKTTQYIAVQATAILKPYCRSVQFSSGRVTDYLRRIWGYDRIIEALEFPNYKKAGLTEVIEIVQNGNVKKIERIKDWSKRLDHRHHAVDALVIACTRVKDTHFLNNINKTIQDFKKVDETYEEAVKRFGGVKAQIPRPFEVNVTKNAVAGILVSFKSGKRLFSRVRQKVGRYRKGPYLNIPRRALHKESVYGKVFHGQEEIKLNAFTADRISLIVDEELKLIIRDLISVHSEGSLKPFKQKGFKLPSPYSGIKSIKCWVEEVVIRREVNENLTKKQISDILDKVVKSKIEDRLDKFNGNPKKAFNDLVNNPIWFDEVRKIMITSVRCKTGSSGVVQIPRGWVEPGDNYAIGIYKDNNGKRSEKVVSYFEAFACKQNKINIFPITDDQLGQLQFTMAQNEMFIFGLDRDELSDKLKTKDYVALNSHLYRVQKISSTDYLFRKHTDTDSNDKNKAKKAMKYFIRYQSLKNFNPIKVRVNGLGVIKVTE